MSVVAKIFSAELEGVDARLVEVEVDVTPGLHAFNIVGLADKALTEARERVNAALKNSQIKPPSRENRRITVNLAPADVKKAGSHYDLPIALGFLIATGQIKPTTFDRSLFIGELSLNGNLRPVPGALNIAELAHRLGFKNLILPSANSAEAAAISDVKVIPADSIISVIDILERRKVPTFAPPPKLKNDFVGDVTIGAIRGQSAGKRALTVAAAGGHNLLMSGPPGSGKSMLAKSLISILPPFSHQEAIETTKIHSVAGLSGGQLITHRPFRSPHHTASTVSIVGGGSNPRPGEISLAHRGILFLDEIAEYRRDVLESLRQPLEDGYVSVARARGVIKFPARFSLIAAMNPCPCGYWGDPDKNCSCTANEIMRYQKKLSGPLLDRLDLQINIPRLSSEELLSPREADHHETYLLRHKVLNARQKQTKRFQNLKLPFYTNSELSSQLVEQIIKLDSPSLNFLKTVITKSLLSPRGYFRLLKVARTIADLDEDESVTLSHLKEAFQYRLRENRY